MAGILKSIQKKHSPPISSPVVEQRRTSGNFDRRRVEAEQLLAGLVEESATLKPASPGTRVVMRPTAPRGNGEIQIRENSLPEWERPVSKLPPALEPTLLACNRTLLGRLQELGSVPDQIQPLIDEAVDKFSEQLGWKELDLIRREIAALFASLGPLEVLFNDSQTTEIFIDSFKSVKVRRKGLVIETPFCFRDNEEYELFTAGLLAPSGALLSREHPILDCILEHRGAALVNALHSSVSGDTRVTIRIPRAKKVSFYDLLQTKVLPATLAAWLAEVISQGEANILIVGQNNSEKTILTSALASEVGSDERVITVEELPEIQASTSNLEKLIARPGNARNGAAVTLADLVRAAVRRRPRRLILGDLRDEEAREYLRALESGLTGSIASINGEYPEDGLWRFLDLLTAWEQAPQFSLMRRIVRSINLVISLQSVDSKPCIIEVAEVLPLKGMDFRVIPLVQLDSVVDGKRTWKITCAESYWLRRVAERGSGLRSGPALLPLAPLNSGAEPQ
jgi:pilus assembly protein CpaF